jgi:hypothetical protein
MKSFFVILSMICVFGTCCDLPAADTRTSWSGSIHAKCYCQNTGFKIVKGQTYRFSVTGEWTDWFVKCDAKGPKSPIYRTVMSLMRLGLRVRKEESPHRVKPHFFTPIGNLACTANGAKPLHPFVISEGREWTAPADGILHVFANDWPNKYHNNRGCLTLSISRAQR